MTEAFDTQLPTLAEYGSGGSPKRSGMAFDAMEMTMVPARHQHRAGA